MNRLISSGSRSLLAASKFSRTLRPIRAGPSIRRKSSLFRQGVPTRPASSSAALQQNPPISAEVEGTPDAVEIDPHYDLPHSGWDDSRVSIAWGSDLSWSRYHNIWLRDHCRCPKCFHPVTKQRLVDTFSIPPDIHPSGVESKPEGLEVTWPGNPPHVSLYPWTWLRQNSYDPPIPKDPAAASLHEKILWGSRIRDSPPTVSYEEVMRNDAGVLKWLQRIDQFGFCFVEGVPATPEDTEELCKRIAFIRQTHYGGFWEFTSDNKHGDTAYSTMGLKAHTDNTYFTDPAGLQLFHLLSHTDGQGGQTLLVDGFYVASILKELHPDAFEILTRVRVPAHAAGDAHSIYKPGPGTSGYPLLTKDPRTGDIVQVRYNNDDRSVLTGLQGCEVEEWYDALRAWNKCLTDSDSEFWVQLSPGTAVVVDNYRVLHGRSAFTGKRRMCGAYIGGDEYRSRLRVLEELSKSRAPGGERSVWDPNL